MKNIISELVREFGDAFRPTKVRRVKGPDHVSEIRRLLNQEVYQIIAEYLAKQNEQKKARKEKTCFR
jgi:hypothetical protein